MSVCAITCLENEVEGLVGMERSGMERWVLTRLSVGVPPGVALDGLITALALAEITLAGAAAKRLMQAGRRRCNGAFCSCTGCYATGTSWLWWSLSNCPSRHCTELAA